MYTGGGKNQTSTSLVMDAVQWVAEVLHRYHVLSLTAGSTIYITAVGVLSACIHVHVGIILTVSPGASCATGHLNTLSYGTWNVTHARTKSTVKRPYIIRYISQSQALVE